MGYQKIITYILDSEDGTSLKASGFRCEEENCGGGSWDCDARPRELMEDGKPKYPINKKRRFVKYLQKDKLKYNEELQMSLF